MAKTIQQADRLTMRLLEDGRIRVQASDDGVWLHLTSRDGKRHASFNLSEQHRPGQPGHTSIDRNAWDWCVEVYVDSGKARYATDDADDAVST